MSDQYVGQIRIAAFDWVPRGFVACDGSTMPISQNQALYSLIGGVFGAITSTTFVLPELRGHTFFGQGYREDTGVTYQVGKGGGAEDVTLTSAQTPPHNHSMAASTVTGNVGYGNAIMAGCAPLTSGGPVNPMYAAPAQGSVVVLNNSVTTSGGAGAHDNLQPYLALKFIIATTGYYPARP